jgi:hypothetical protein
MFCHFCEIKKIVAIILFLFSKLWEEKLEKCVFPVYDVFFPMKKIATFVKWKKNSCDKFCKLFNNWVLWKNS